VVDEVEVGLDRAAHPLLVVVGGGHRALHLRHDRVTVGVEQRQIELELSGEVLVEDGLGNARALRDVVHRGGVVPLRHEDLLRRLQELLAARGTRQARGPACRRRASRPYGHAVTSTFTYDPKTFGQSDGSVNIDLPTN
jgi:hypothetical protein